MSLHFLHIGKTGGTAIKHALRSNDVTRCRYGELIWHSHRFTLRDATDNDSVFFCVRDPLRRFLSAFDSRKRKGQPRYYSEWTDAEQETFKRWQSPNDLGHAIAEGDPSAVNAVRSIRHVQRPLRHWLGSPQLLRRGRVAYIARLETLSVEWPRIRDTLGIPESVELPTDPVHAHHATSAPQGLDDIATAALRGLFADDYVLLDVCDQLRIERGWREHSKAGDNPTSHGASL